MTLNRDIIKCQKCPLYKHMKVSPITPEQVGSPKSMWIIGTTMGWLNDKTQQSVVGINRTILLKYFEKFGLNDWYLTPFVKCTPKYPSYKVDHIKQCIKWLKLEHQNLKPKIVIGCGDQVKKYIKVHYYLPPISKLVTSKQNEEKLREIIEKISEFL